MNFISVSGYKILQLPSGGIGLGFEGESVEAVSAAKLAARRKSVGYFGVWAYGRSGDGGAGRRALDGRLELQSSTTGGWPRHDPCGLNQTNQITSVVDPRGAIYLR